jgi:hypothetical protein
MNLSRRYMAVLLMAASLTAAGASAGQSSSSAAVSIPQQISFKGTVKAPDGKPATGILPITFLIYEEDEGGSPLWIETQDVTLDAAGHYSVMLGARTRGGLPAELFASKAARWLGIEPQGLPVQPRVPLVSVPYAFKAGDAETIGGLPPSAFLRADAISRGSIAEAQSPSAISATAPAGSGTVNYIPRWTPNGTTLGNSALFQSGTGAAAKIGINTNAPAATLDVAGGVIARGALQLPSKGAASASKGLTSQPLTLQASVFSSTKHAAVSPKFEWQAEPAGNNTAGPGATMNLLYGATGTPVETGLFIAGNGRITFAPGQTFPGTGKGTITGFAAGTDLVGGGASGNITIGLDTTKVPQLNAANTFTGDQTVNGNLSSSASVSGSTVNAATAFNLDGNAFAFGSHSTSNSFLAFAGNATAAGNNNLGIGQTALLNHATGSGNTAAGVAALKLNGSGSNNSALGYLALTDNTTGASNTAVGDNALSVNTTGSNNTALGVNAGPDPAHQALGNSTAIGANAMVTANNSMVLGSISGVNGATADTLVGIGTTAPAAKLDVHGNANFTGPVTFASGQTFPGTITGVTAGTGLSGGGNSGAVTVNLDTTYSDGRYAQLGANNTFTGRQIINNSVGIGITPSYPLHVSGSIRSESGLSLGGNAPLQVDAPGIIAGHFLVTSAGRVGIDNNNPSTTLDVGGNINASGYIDAGGTLIGQSLNVSGSGLINGGLTTSAGITAGAGVSVGAGLTVGGSVQIGGDTPMSAAPHMSITAYVPAPLNAGVIVRPIFTIPSKNILITRMTSNGWNPCTNSGAETFTIYTGGQTGVVLTSHYTQTLTGSFPTINDSGALSITVTAGTPLWVISNATPSCPLGSNSPGDIAITLEYVMK